MSALSPLKTDFNLDCRECTRLADFLDEVGDDYPEYHARPVAPFGDKKAKLLIVGLAPGMHGANATGRPFTGDHAGILLYETLHKFGLSNQAKAVSRNDGLQLINCRITNAVKCLPPQNKPTGKEINTCNRYLKNELKSLDKGSVVLSLGTIAHNAILKALDLKMSAFKFGHAQIHDIGHGSLLLDSYHCSRYNTQTKRLTEKMFHDVFRVAKKLLK